MKKILLLASLTLFLTGCSDFVEGFKDGYNSALEDQKSQETVKDLKTELQETIEVETVTISESEYGDYIKGKLDVISNNQQIIVNVFNNGSTLDNPMEQMADATLENIKVSKELQNAVVPDKYKSTHQYFVSGTTSYLVYLDKIKEGLLVNEVHVSDVMDKYNEANDFFNKGMTSLIELDPVSVGDGSITTEDLKGLDSLAGIDHDSVVMNISYDGNELIGKWLYNDNSVAIVLNADGSYEGYGSGHYPNKDNAMLGTWEYDYTNQLLIIKNNEVYQYGESVTVNRPKQEMVLTYFKDNTLRMMDSQTLAEFSFNKGY